MRPSFLVALLAGVLSTGAFAGEWISDVDSGCQVWNANPAQGESIKWTGSCVGGKATGRGTTQWFLNNVPGTRVEGEYRDGKRNGKSFVKYANGETYNGDFVDGVMSGKGVGKWPNGSTYEGGYLNAKRHGFGSLSLVRSDPAVNGYAKDGFGRWRGDLYVVSGLFEDSRFVLECADVKACEKQTTSAAETRPENKKAVEGCALFSLVANLDLEKSLAGRDKLSYEEVNKWIKSHQMIVDRGVLDGQRFSNRQRQACKVQLTEYQDYKRANYSATGTDAKGTERAVKNEFGRGDAVYFKAKGYYYTASVEDVAGENYQIKVVGQCTRANNGDLPCWQTSESGQVIWATKSSIFKDSSRIQ